MRLFQVSALALAVGIGSVSAFAKDEAKSEAEKEATHLKHEKHELKAMPKGAKEAIEKETVGGTEMDYYTVKVDGHNQFGATFVAADGKHMDLRVDHDGKVISKLEDVASAQATAAAAAAAATKTEADKEAAARAAAAAAAGSAAANRPAVAVPAMPGIPAATPAVAKPGVPNADGQTAADLAAFPKPAHDVIAGETTGMKNVMYYTSADEGKPVYEAEYDQPDGKHIRLRVRPDGRITSKTNENALTSMSKGELVAIDTVPAAPKKTLEGESLGMKNPQFFKVTEDGKPAYEAVFHNGPDKILHVFVAQDGKLIRKHTDTVTPTPATK